MHIYQFRPIFSVKMIVYDNCKFINFPKILVVFVFELFIPQLNTFLVIWLSQMCRAILFANFFSFAYELPVLRLNQFTDKLYCGSLFLIELLFLL